MHEHDLERAARYLVDHPPAPPAPVAELERRAHRRRRRRAVATGLSAAVAVAAGALVIDRGDDRQIVTTPSSQDPADATSGTTEVVEPLADHQVTVTPDWGPPGTEIRIHGSGFGDTASGPGRQPGVELFLVDIEGERAAHLGHATIDADGHFVLDTTVPGEMSSPGGGPTGGPTVPVEPGEYQISVGASASIVHAGTFVVTPPPVPAGQVVFDEPVGVVGAVVELQAGGFEDRRGEEVSAWFIFPRGPTSEIASGLVDAEGRLAIDLQVPLVLEHEHWVEPGTYFVALLPRDGPKQEAVVTTLEVGAAQVGQTYRFDHHHDCLDYVHFDRRLWVPLAPPGGAPSSQAGRIGVSGTFTVTDDARAVFATETGAQLALRAATAEEARAYDPELFECPGSGPGGIPPLDPGEARRAQEVVAEFLAHLRAGDLESASHLWSGFQPVTDDPVATFEQLRTGFPWLADGPEPELVVTPSGGWGHSYPVVTAFLPGTATEPGQAAAFVLSTIGAGDGQLRVDVLPNAVPADFGLHDLAPSPGSPLRPGEELTFLARPVEGGVTVHVDGIAVPVSGGEVDVGDPIRFTVRIPDLVRDQAVVTIAVASPDLPGAAAHWYPISEG